MEMAKGVLDRLTFYINPEMFKKEQEYKEKGTTGSTKVNMEFERHKASMRETGKIDLNPDMARMIEKMEKSRIERGQGNFTQTTFLHGNDGAPVQMRVLKPSNPEELGD